MRKVKVVSQRFEKFFNFGEPLAAEIDWSAAKVTEKIDGSIIGGWYDEGAWHFSTNGVINAFNCDLQLPRHDCASFGDLFMIAACETCDCNWGEFLQHLDPVIMYTWELATPWNRVVVPHKENKIYLIGARNADTLEELDVWTRADLLPMIPRPKTYPMTSAEEIEKALSTLPYDEEGYVVMDSHFNRTKWKGHQYLAAHHLKDNGNVSLKRVFELVKANEIDEFLAYFPEYTDIFNKVKDAWAKIQVRVAVALASADGFKKRGITKKEFAKIVMREDPILRPFMFAEWDGKDIQAMLDRLDADDILGE